MAAKPRVNITIVSDLTCPFCWIGKKRLESSMKKLEDKMEFHVKWSPFQLRPDAPSHGMPVPREYQDPRRLAQIRLLGEEVGIQLNFNYACLPNTTQAHVLMHYVGMNDDGNKQSEVAEMLFKTHFTFGTMLAGETLVSIGQQAGFDGDEVRAFINSPTNLIALRQASQENRGKVSGGGVPMYYFNGQRMFSGAQSEEVFTNMLINAAKNFPAAGPSKA